MTELSLRKVIMEALIERLNSHFSVDSLEKFEQLRITLRHESKRIGIMYYSIDNQHLFNLDFSSFNAMTTMIGGKNRVRAMIIEFDPHDESSLDEAINKVIDNIKNPPSYLF